jgi:hypothetical protein
MLPPQKSPRKKTRDKKPLQKKSSVSMLVCSILHKSIVKIFYRFTLHEKRIEPRNLYPPQAGVSGVRRLAVAGTAMFLCFKACPCEGGDRV